MTRVKTGNRADDAAYAYQDALAAQTAADSALRSGDRSKPNTGYDVLQYQADRAHEVLIAAEVEFKTALAESRWRLAAEKAKEKLDADRVQQLSASPPLGDLKHLPPR